MTRLAALLCLLLGLAAAQPLLGPLAAPAMAQPVPEPLRKSLRADNPVVARVDGAEIRWNDVILSARDLPPDYQARVQEFFPILLGRMIDLQLIANQARAEGVNARPDFQERLRQLENQLLQEFYLADVVNGAVSEAEVQKRVEVMTAGNEREEVRLSIIVTPSEEAARAALRRLNSGGDFSTVAREASIDPSAVGGGDLGFFARAEIQPPEVAQEAFDLLPGHYSPVPLRTEVGWIIVKVTERRMAEPLPKAEVAERIRRELGRLAIDKLLVTLREKAVVDLFPAQ